MIIDILNDVLTEDLNLTVGYTYFENKDYIMERIKLHDIHAGN